MGDEETNPGGIPRAEGGNPPRGANSPPLRNLTVPENTGPATPFQTPGELNRQVDVVPLNVNQGGPQGIDPLLLAGVTNMQSRYNPAGGPPRTENGNNTGRNRPTYANNTNPQGDNSRPIPPGENPYNERNAHRPQGNENPSNDPSSKEGKFDILDEIDRNNLNRATYEPTSNEIFFAKMKWQYDGTTPFEDYIVKLGGYCRTLNVGMICYKNTLFHSFKAPCSAIIADMEPSLKPYITMSKREYTEALLERLEPASACDLIYVQYKERAQKANEVYDLYLRDRYNLFLRSYPEGKVRIFKDFIEESVRGLHNEN